MSKTLECLNEAFRRDPNAMHALIVNRVPCNSMLADDPYVVVDRSPVLDGVHWQVGAIGLINGILAANGLPLVAYVISEDRDEEGRGRMIGFCEYRVQHEPVAAS